MPYVPTEADRLAVKTEVQDLDPALPVLDDSTYNYILTKNNGSIAFSSIDAARMILMRLSYNVDEVVDILSLKGSKAAEQWRYALELYIKNPMLNPIYKSVNPYAGGISNSDIATNLADPGQNTVTSPTEPKRTYTNDNPFMI